MTADRLPPSVAEAAFHALLASRRDAVVAAVGPDGLFVPLPETLDIGGHRTAVARSGLELVTPASALPLIEAWERAHALGSASTMVELLGGAAAEVLFFDLEANHGTYATVLVPVLDGQPLPDAAVVAQVRPRLGRVTKDQAAFILSADEAASAMFGFPVEELVGRRSIEFVHPDDHGAAITAWMEILAAPGATHRVRVRHLCGDGSWRWIEIGNRNLLHDPEVGVVECDVLDISEEMAAIDALREREELLARMAGALPVAVVHFDAQGQVRYANDRLYELVGLPPGAAEDDLLACVVDLPALVAAFERVQAGVDVDVDALLDRADGTGRRQCTVALRSLSDAAGRPSGGVACITDVTESMRLRGELEARATYDALTGCANRATILGALEQRLAERGRGLAAVFVDLDAFKAVNDQLGHGAGDTLLVAAAARLRDGVRAGDVVGRLGGDEFLAVCPDVPDAATAALVGERIAESLNGPLDIGGHRVQLRASVGVGWTGGADGPVDADVLIARADGAMYASKRAGEGRPVVAVGGTPEEAVPARRLAVDDRGEALRRAVDEGELDVHFQAVHEAAGRLVGFEALLRWRRAGRLVPAAEFIDVAEATGLICEVGPWVVDEVCRRAVASRRTDLTWFVNLSPRELAAPRTIAAVGRALDRHGLPPSSLVVEITEHAALADGGVACSVVSELAAMGVVAAVDDFGSGWSSLSSLLAVPAAWLKIDRRFVAAAGTPTGGAIVAGVVDLARRLGVRTIAEGVELPAELEAVRSLGVDCAQGHLLGRPGPLEELLVAAGR